MSGANTFDIRNAFENRDGLAVDISEQWMSWKTARSVAESRWDEVIQYVFATSTRETTNNKNPWSHSTHRPKITQIYENMLSNIVFSIMPKDRHFRYEGYDPNSHSKEKRDMVEAYIETKHRLSKFRSAIHKLVSDWLLFGNCFAMVTYVEEKHIDPDIGIETTGYVGPKIERISPYDLVMNPLADSFEKTPKIIRGLKTMGELILDAEEKPELNYSRDIIEKVKEFRSILSESRHEDIDKHVQIKFDGYGSPSQYFNSGYVEILEFYGDIYDQASDTFMKNHVVTIVDRMWVIRKEPLKTMSGKPHIYHCGWRTRPDNLWAMGVLDNLIGMQYRINHLENALADAFDQMLDPDLILAGSVEEKKVLDEFGNETGATRWLVEEGGSVGQLVPDTTVLNANFQIDKIEKDMEEMAGAPREAMGIRSPGEKTKYEVQQLQNASSRMFQQKVNYFDEQFIEPILNAEIEVARRNLNVSDIIRTLDSETGALLFRSITKDDITANGKLVPIGSRHFARVAQTAQDISQFLSIIRQDPLMVQHFPSEKVAGVLLDVLELDKFDLFKPYGRVEEEANLARLQNTANDQVQAEAQTPIDEDDDLDMAGLL